MAIDTETLYREYGPMVLRRCRQLLRDEQKAVDTMQDVFVAILQQRHRLTQTAPHTLLYRTATRLCLNVLRTGRRRPENPDDELLMQIAQLEDLEERSAAKFILEKLFGSRPESTRTIAVLHLVDGMTHEEVARHVGLSVSGVRKRLRVLKGHLTQLSESPL